MTGRNLGNTSQPEQRRRTQSRHDQYKSGRIIVTERFFGYQSINSRRVSP